MLREIPPGDHVMSLTHVTCGLIAEGVNKVTSLLLRCYCVNNVSYVDHVSCEVLMRSLRISNDVIKHVILEQVCINSVQYTGMVQGFQLSWIKF